MEPVAALEAIITADTTGYARSLGAAEVSLRQFATTTEQQAGKAAKVFVGDLNAMGQAAAAAGGSFAGVGLAAERAANGGIAAADKAMGRFLDSQGKLRESNGRFVNAATLAAEAAGKLGDAATKAAFDLEKLGKAGDVMKSAGTALSVGVTAPLVLFGASALNAAGNFESAFNRVEAATLASGNELDSLRKKALDISLDPTLKFSASDAAAALENLAKNGLDTRQILEGAADASVNLATATGGQLATSADIATDVMNNFNLTAQQLAASVDNITGTTIASKLDIDNYRQALGQAGGVAGQLGVQFSDFNTALAVTSSGFSSGSDAGTSFKTFLQRLVPQSKEAKVAMDKLGLSFFDAGGQLLPLREIAGRLQTAFKGLSDEQRNLAGTQIFGADSIRTALLLAKSGSEGFDQMAASIGKVKAASQGAILSKGFSGALEAAKSALEGFQIALGESGLLDFGTRFLKAGAGLLSGLSELDPAVLRVGTALAAAAAAIGPLLLGLGSLGAAIPAIVTGLGTIGAAVGLAAGPLALLVVGVGAAVAAIITNWDEIVNYFEGPDGLIFKELARSIGESVDSIADAFNGLAGSGLGNNNLGDLLLGGLQVALKEVATGLTAMLDLVNGAVRTVSSLLEGDWARAWDGAKQAVNGLLGPLANLFGYDYASLRQSLGVLGDAPREGASVLTNQFIALNEGLAGFVDFAEEGGFVGGDLAAGLDKVSEAAAKAVGFTEAQNKALQALLEALRLNAANSRALGDSYDYMGGKQSALESGIKSLIKAGFNPLGSTVQGFVSQLRTVPEALTKVETDLSRFFDRITKQQESQRQADFQPFGKLILPVLPTELGGYDEQLDRFREAVGRPFMVGAIDTLGFTTAADTIVDASSTVVNSITGMSNATVERLTTFNTEIESLFDSLGGYVSNGLATIAGGIGDAAAAIIAGGASVGDGVSIIFKSILLALADFMGQFGQQLIAIGVGKLALDTLFKGPAGGPLAIAAGVGLVALAGVAKALIKSSASSVGSIGSGGGAGGISTPTGPNANQRQAPLQLELKMQPVTIRQSGPDLAGVLAFESYRQRRVS
jgi:TP901 family phage tail tape measure protein